MSGCMVATRDSEHGEHGEDRKCDEDGPQTGVMQD